MSEIESSRSASRLERNDGGRLVVLPSICHCWLMQVGYLPDLLSPLPGRDERRVARAGHHAMSVFTEAELRYLTGGRQLGRIATVGRDGTPHVVPVGWIYNAARDTIDVAGYELELSKKFRDVASTGRAAIVIDDVESVDPWRPRAVEVRGRAEAITLPTPLIRIYPERIISWGLGESRSARTVT